MSRLTQQFDSHLSSAKLKGARVRFAAIKTKSDFVADSTIDFEAVPLNYGGGMRLSGAFTAPVTGIYKFQISWEPATSRSPIDLVKADGTHLRLRDSRMVITKVLEGQTAHLVPRAHGGAYAASENHPFTFYGEKLD